MAVPRALKLKVAAGPASKKAAAKGSGEGAEGEKKGEEGGEKKGEAGGKEGGGDVEMGEAGEAKTNDFFKNLMKKK